MRRNIESVSFAEMGLRKVLGVSPINDLVSTSLSHVFCTELPKHWRSNKSLPIPFRVVSIIPVPENTKIWISAGNEERPHAELKNAMAIMNVHEARFSDLRFLGRSGRGKSFNVNIHIETNPPQVAVYAKAIKVTVDGPRVPRNKYGTLKIPRLFPSSQSYGACHMDTSINSSGAEDETPCSSAQGTGFGVEGGEQKTRTEFLQILKRPLGMMLDNISTNSSISAGRGRKRKFNFHSLPQPPQSPNQNLLVTNKETAFDSTKNFPIPGQYHLDPPHHFLNLFKNERAESQQNISKCFSEYLSAKGLPAFSNPDLMLSLMQRNLNNQNSNTNSLFCNKSLNFPINARPNVNDVSLLDRIFAQNSNLKRLDPNLLIRFEEILKNMKSQRKQIENLAFPNWNNLQQKLLQLKDLNRITEKFLGVSMNLPKIESIPDQNQCPNGLLKKKYEQKELTKYEPLIKRTNFTINSVIEPAKKSSSIDSDEDESVSIEGRTPASQNSGTSSHSPPLTGNLEDEFPILHKRVTQQDSSDDMSSTVSSNEQRCNIGVENGFCNNKNLILSNLIFSQLLRKTQISDA